MRPVRGPEKAFRKLTAGALSVSLALSSASPAFAGRVPGRPSIKAQTFRAAPIGAAPSGAEAVLKYGLKMAGKERGRPEGLAEAVSSSLSEKSSMSERLISLSNAFAGHGAPFEQRFSFGALKGLLTLYGERYVSDEEFERLLRREIGHVLKAKLPLALWEKISG